MRYICLFMFSFFATTTQAQAISENGYDGTIPFECTNLASKYRAQQPFAPHFPSDAKRADAVIKNAIDGAYEGCAGCDYTLCFVLSEPSHKFTTQPDDPRYALAARVAARVKLTEVGCATGNSDACDTRANTFSIYDIETDEVGIAVEMAKGLSREQASAAIFNSAQDYTRRTSGVAKAQITALRTTCNDARPEDCAALGRMLYLHSPYRIFPIEHFSYVIDACTVDRPDTCQKAVAALSPTFYPNQTPDMATRQAHAIEGVKATCVAGNGAHCAMLAWFDGGVNAKVRTIQACDFGVANTCLDLANSDLSKFSTTNNTDILQTATDRLEQACSLSSNIACHSLEHLTKG